MRRAVVSFLVLPMALVGLGAGPDPDAALDEDLPARTQWFLERRATPDGSHPWLWRLRALDQLRKNLAAGSLRATDGSGDSWESIGPSPMVDGAAEYTGRVSAITAHPTDASTVYVGTANGGVWKTTDAGVTWTPITDFEDSLAVGTIAIDPSDSQTVYVGTGEANGICPIYGGAGILKSTDGGASWTRLAESTFGGTGISGIVVHPSTPQTLWASNREGTLGMRCALSSGPYGVWKSLDGGVSWTLVLGPAQTSGNGSTSDLAISPSDPDLLLAGVPSSGVWRSADGGGSWMRAFGILGPQLTGRVAIAFDPVVPTDVYASVEDPLTGGHAGLWKSTNGGITFSRTGQPGAGSCMGYAISDLCTYTDFQLSQCYFYFDVAIAPDRDVWLAGLGIYRSGDGGATWSSKCLDTVHVDQHAIAFGADGKVWYGNDGGVFSTTDDGASWQPHNTGLDVGQFYPGGSAHPTDPDFVLGGTQDNGAMSFMGLPAWNVVDPGDRWRTAISGNDPDVTWYTSGIGMSVRKSTDAGATWNPARNGIPDGEYGDTFAPWLACPDDPDLFIGGTDNVWRSDDAMGAWNPNSPDPLVGIATDATAAAFLPAGNGCNTYFVAFEDGTVWRTTDGGGNWAEITSGGLGGPVSDLAVDPRAPATLWASIQTFGVPHLKRTTNALDPTPVWTIQDAGIPDSPGNGVIVDPRRDGVVWLATDIGVFHSEDDGQSWVSSSGHPLAVVVGFAVGPQTREVFSFTHGRGAFRLIPDCGGACAPVGETLLGAKGPTEVSYSWSPVACPALDAYVVYGAETFSASFPSEWTVVGAGPDPAHTEPLGSPYVAFRVVTENACGDRSN